MKRMALIDGDEAAFKACAVTANNIDWGDGEESKVPSTGLAIKAARELIEAWSKKVEADVTVVALSCRDRKHFRRQIDPFYKVERTEKPEAYWRVIDMIREEYEYLEYSGLEADDVMGIHSTPRGGLQPVIVSSDKDMKTVAGAWLYDPYHGTKRKIDETSADRWWMTQTLTGDPSDGFKGLPGCGPKSEAVKALATAPNLSAMWRIVVDAYKAGTKKYGVFTEKDAIGQARLARILRPGDFDIENGVVRLWHPVTPELFNVKESK